jgi:uncharacterized membrane protein YhaH (DUF805 family)
MVNPSILDSAITPLKKYFVFSGRAGRKEFWAFFFLTLIVEIALMSLDVYYGLYFANNEFGLFSGIFSLVTLIPFLAVAVRRFHDIDKSGLHLLWMFIPFLGAVALVAFWLRRSHPNSNQYGMQPT